MMNYQKLKEEIKTIHITILEQAIKKVNTFLTIRNGLIGYYIVEYEQNGQDRAMYASGILDKLSKDLTRELGKGFSSNYLQQFRKFYLLYPIYESMIHILAQKNLHKNIIVPSPKLIRNLRDQRYMDELISQLTWTHFIELIKIDDETKRSFYEIECLKNRWSVRELIRQKNSMLFERMALSKDKSKVLQMAQEGTIVESAQDLIKNPFIFEFLGLKEETSYNEHELETALIHHLQEFLFEMGKGFCFVARQYRITFDNDHYYVDLVLYNRYLKALILIDLKIRDFKPEDAGQMNFYLNYFRINETISGENEPIGIILCAGKKNVVVEYAFGNIDNRILTGEYRLVLPTPEELQQEIKNYKDKLVNTDNLKTSETGDVKLLSLEEQLATNIKGVVKKRCLLLMEYLQKNHIIKTSGYNRLTKVSNRTTHRDLSLFQKENIIVFIGAKKTGHYELTEKSQKFLMQQ